MVGAATAPLLLSLAVDSVVALLLIRSRVEMHAAPVAARAGIPRRIAGWSMHRKAMYLPLIHISAAAKYFNVTDR
jgi:hypothetical protein